jgi:hypothetical protein
MMNITFTSDIDKTKIITINLNIATDFLQSDIKLRKI